MKKRQLDSEYKDLVDYVESNVHDQSLIQIIQKLRDRDFVESNIADRLFEGFATSYDFNELIPILVDIYNDNYELKSAKHIYTMMKFSVNDVYPYLTKDLVNDYSFTTRFTDADALTDDEFKEALDYLGFDKGDFEIEEVWCYG